MNGLNAIRAEAGTTSAGIVNACFDIGGAGALRNDVQGAVPAGTELRVRQRFSSTVRLPGYGGTNIDTAAVNVFHLARNIVTAGSASSTVAVPPGGGFVGGAACAQAPLAPFLDEGSVTGGEFPLQTDQISQAIPDSIPMTKRLALIGNVVQQIYKGLTEAVSPTVSAEETSKISYGRFSGETITVGAPTGFTLPAGKSFTIRFRATVNNTPVGLTQISTQGTVSGSNFASVLTDDPAEAGGANPTATLIDSTTITVSSSQNPSITGQSVTFTATLTGAPVHATGDPGGTVQFFDNGVAIGAPQTVAAGAANDNTGTATLVVSNLTAGSHPITATFSGGGTGPGGFNANNTSNTVNQSVSNTAVWDGSTSTAWADGTNWTTNGAPSLATNDVSIPAAGVTNNPTIGAANVTVNNLTLSAGRTLTVNTNRTLNINGLLTMNGNNIDASGGVVAFGPGGTVTRTSGSILGNVDKSFTATGAFNYTVGTATGFSPVSVDVTALATSPSSLRVLANDGTAPSVPVLVDATTLDRFWTLTETGDLTANVVFNYLTADVDGVEANYKTVRVTGTTPAFLLNGVPCPGGGSPCVDSGANTIAVNGLQAFSNWTAGEFTPTAANVSVGGRAVDIAGKGVFNARLTLTDGNGNIRFARTNPFGFYRFEDVVVGQTYLLTAEHKRFAFDSQLVSVNDQIEDLIVVAASR